MRINLLDEYTIGHSQRSPDDIIIGDSCGRWVPLDVAALDEIIAVLKLFSTDATVDPDEFIRRGEELSGSIDTKLCQQDDTLEALFQATRNEAGDLYWRGTDTLLDDPFPEDVYCRLVLLHEERG